MKKLLMIVMAVFVSNALCFGATQWENMGDITILSADNVGGFGGTIDSSGLYLDKDSPTGSGTHLEIVNGGSISGVLYAYTNSTVLTQGNAYIGSTVAALNKAIISLNDDTIISGNLQADHDTKVTMHDNTSVEGLIHAHRNGILDIYVQEFAIDGGITYGDEGVYDLNYYGSAHTYGRTGSISGIMEGGLEFNNSWHVYNLGYNYAGTGTINIHVVPEPMTMSLIALGGIVAIRRRKI